MIRTRLRVPVLLLLAVAAIVTVGVAYALLDSGSRLSDVERERDYQRAAAQNVERLLYAVQDSTLRSLAARNGPKGKNMFVYGVVEVRVDSTWTRVISVRW